MNNTSSGALFRSLALSIDGIRSPAIEAGQADAAEAVVFVHGNPGSTRDWEDLLAKAGGIARALAFDMPGFGEADKPAGFDYSVPGYARHLGALLNALKVERAHLVMHDFGGTWGLAWAAANPGKVASVTCIDTGVLIDYQWHFLARIWQTPLLGEIFMATTTKAGMRLLAKIGNPRGLPKEYFEHVFRTFDAGTRRAVLKLYRNTRDTSAPMRSIAASLRPLDLPALVVWGAHDPYIPAAFAERQREVFPRAKISVLEDSGHWPFIDNPSAVAAVVLPFLKSQLTNERSRA